MYGGILYWTDLSMSSFVTVLYPWHCKTVNIHTLLSLLSLLPCCPLKSRRKWEEEEHPALGGHAVLQTLTWLSHLPSPSLTWTLWHFYHNILGKSILHLWNIGPSAFVQHWFSSEVKSPKTWHYSQYVYHIKVICQRNDVHKVFLCYSVNLFLGHNMIWLPWDRWFSLLLPLWSKGCNRTEGVLMSSQSPHINHLI